MVRVRPQATAPARLGATTHHHTRPCRRTMPSHHARRHTLHRTRHRLRPHRPRRQPLTHQPAVAMQVAPQQENRTRSTRRTTLHTHPKRPQTTRETPRTQVDASTAATRHSASARQPHAPPPPPPPGAVLRVEVLWLWLALGLGFFAARTMTTATRPKRKGGPIPKREAPNGRSRTCT
jgi:hypothetical protein